VQSQSRNNIRVLRRVRASACCKSGHGQHAHVALAVAAVEKIIVAE
jgi:hypothetical protein